MTLWRWLLAGAIVVVAGCGERAHTEAPPKSDEAAASEPETGPIETRPAKPLTFMTYNVLVDRVAPEQRMEAIVGIMHEHRPDVIALQEAAPWFLEGLLEQSWVQEDYVWPQVYGRPFAPGGQFILSKHRILKTDWVKLSGKQRRTAVAVYLHVYGRTMLVATTHLESLPEDGPVREQQLEEVFALVNGAEDAVVLGDFNFGDGAAEESRIPPEFADLWTTIRPDEPGFTWNIEASEMARKESFPGEPSSRIDRILLKSRLYRPSWVMLVGNEPLTNDCSIFPSDHFGVVGAVSPSEGNSTD